MVIHTPSEAAEHGVAPILGDVGVVAFVPDHFDGPWQPRHQVMTRLARYFHVVWMEPPPGWREVAASWVPGRSNGEHSVPRDGGMGEPPPASMVVHDPGRTFPRIFKPRVLGEFTARARARSALRLLREKGCTQVALYLWRPGFEAELDRIPHQVSCYHIDDDYSFSSEERSTSPQELKVLRRVDQVFIHSPALMEKKGGVNPNTDFIPNGVNYHSFATPVPDPADMAGIPHPRIGYVGFLKKQLDWTLLEGLAGRHPEWSFVLVGPRHAHPEIQDALRRMEERENVYFLGGKPVTELGGYPQHFDVSILPYAENDYTRYINPLKLYEYLASGSPVVGVPIRTLQDFEGQVRLASGLDEWSGALKESLSPDERAPERREARQEVARRYDWDILVERVARTLAGRLGGGLVERLEQQSPAAGE
jgi:glycosyltransferase involved in cell wall biosynthesis